MHHRTQQDTKIVKCTSPKVLSGRQPSEGNQSGRDTIPHTGAGAIFLNVVAKIPNP